jgi:glycosyltransferase involved in cell wall biosynthesis
MPIALVHSRDVPDKITALNKNVPGSAVPFPSSSAASAAREPKVAVLLCTYCGQTYLPQQLDSIADQRYKNWLVLTSNDDNQDATWALLESYKNKWGANKISTIAGPQKGFVANFLSLASKAVGLADYYAYSDQDDVWDDDKLLRAVTWLKSVPKDTPALYCSRTRLIDEHNRSIGLSPLFSKPPHFANALIQNIGGGNTMVFNDAACRIIALGEDTGVVIHDWWAYMAVTGCGGRVFYDPQPSLSYRQHTSNLIGDNMGFRSRIRRIFMIFAGCHKKWNDRNIKALRLLGDKLTQENKRTLDLFDEARSQPLFKRLIGIKRSGVYRQTFFGSLGLLVAAIFKKL